MPNEDEPKQSAPELTQQRDAALVERNAMWVDSQRVRSLEAELAYTREIIAEMQRSLSWRVTTPLRTFKTYARQGRRGLGRLRRAAHGG